MALIDLSLLDQEQLWAITWGRQQANESIQWQIDNANAQNAQIVAENEKLLPEHQKPLLPVPELYTDQTWADSQVWQWVNQQLVSFQNRVKQNVEVKIAALSLEERLQLMASLQVDPVLKPE